MEFRKLYLTKDEKELVRIAKEARLKAYAPYSQFSVGVALSCSDGSVFKGFNIENASYGATICAEQVAVVRAISEGYRDFKKMVIIADTKNPIPPCGVCRQFISEFSSELEVIMTNLKEEIERKSITDLLPNKFRAEELHRNGCNE